MLWACHENTIALISRARGGQGMRYRGSDCQLAVPMLWLEAATFSRETMTGSVSLDRLSGDPASSIDCNQNRGLFMRVNESMARSIPTGQCGMGLIRRWCLMLIVLVGCLATAGLAYAAPADVVSKARSEAKALAERGDFVPAAECLLAVEAQDGALCMEAIAYLLSADDVTRVFNLGEALASDRSASVIHRVSGQMVADIVYWLGELSLIAEAIGHGLGASVLAETSSSRLKARAKEAGVRASAALSEFQKLSRKLRSSRKALSQFVSERDAAVLELDALIARLVDRKDIIKSLEGGARSLARKSKEHLKLFQSAFVAHERLVKGIESSQSEFRASKVQPKPMKLVRDKITRNLADMASDAQVGYERATASTVRLLARLDELGAMLRVLEPVLEDARQFIDSE